MKAHEVTSTFDQIKDLIAKGMIVTVDGSRIIKSGTSLLFKGVKFSKQQWDLLVKEPRINTAEGSCPEIGTVGKLYNSTSWNASTKACVKVADMPDKATVLVIPVQAIEDAMFLDDGFGNKKFKISLASYLTPEIFEETAKKLQSSIRRRGQ